VTATSLVLAAVGVPCCEGGLAECSRDANCRPTTRGRFSVAVEAPTIRTFCFVAPTVPAEVSAIRAGCAFTRVPQSMHFSMAGFNDVPQF